MHLESCRVSKVFIPFHIQTQGLWADTGLDTLQGILKVLQPHAPHLKVKKQVCIGCRVHLDSA